ncbi:MAG: BMP family ABC transporter substrate-binding protein [Butyrivibrio sp.]|nr:BMP family ABC transporter substrate-binding protein [Butyrivibrio sp.]
MKRSLSLILIIALLIGIYQAVGYNIRENSNENALNVAIIVPTTFGDKSFNDSAHRGGEALEKEGMNVRYIECGGDAYKQKIMDNAPECDMVFCVGWQFWEITDVVGQFPNVKFVWIDNEVEDPEDYPNLLNVVYSENEASYLAGYIAAAKTQTGVIGVVGGSDDDTTNNFITGFEQGASDCNDGVDVLTAYADGNYTDPELGRSLAMGLNAHDADIIFQVAGATGSGVFKAAKDYGFYAIGVDVDQKTEFPEYDDVILCSVTKNIGGTIRDIAMNYDDEETFEGGTVMEAGLSDGYVGLNYGSINTMQLVEQSLKEEISELLQDIKNGFIEVDSTR